MNEATPLPFALSSGCLFAFSDAVVVCWLTGWVEAQPIRNAPRNERIVSLSKVDFIVRHLSNAHATTFRCNFSEAAEKFFNEMCPIAVPKAGRHGSSFGTRMSDMTDENRNPAGNYSLGKYVTRRQVARFLTGAGAALILPRRRTNAETSDALRLPFITR